MAGDPSAPRGDRPRHRLERDPRLRLHTTGRPIGKRAKQEHAFTTAADGTATVDAVTVAHEVAAVLDQLVERARTGRSPGSP